MTARTRKPSAAAALRSLRAEVAAINRSQAVIKFDLDGIIQMPIDPAIGNTFAKCLRSILRQDPDKILVGEIRDLETAEIAVQASLTGHLVFSTLHTMTAVDTVNRIISYFPHDEREVIRLITTCERAV